MELVREMFQKYLVSKHKKQEKLKNSTNFKNRNIEIDLNELASSENDRNTSCIIF